MMANSMVKTSGNPKSMRSPPTRNSKPAKGRNGRSERVPKMSSMDRSEVLGKSEAGGERADGDGGHRGCRDGQHREDDAGALKNRRPKMRSKATPTSAPRAMPAISANGKGTAVQRTSSKQK